MEYLGLLAGLAQRFGTDPKTLFVILVMLTFFGGLASCLSLAVYFLRSKIALAEREAIAAAQERSDHIRSLNIQAQTAQGDLKTLMNGKMDAMNTVITKTGVSMDSVNSSLLLLHQKEEARAGKLYEKIEQGFNQVRLDIANKAAS